MGEDVDGLVVPVQQAGHAAHRVQGGTVVGVDIPEGRGVSIIIIIIVRYDPLVEPQVCGHLADAEQGTGAGTWVGVRGGDLGEPEEDRVR